MSYYVLHFVIALSMVAASAIVLGTFALVKRISKLGTIFAFYSYAIAVWAFFQIFFIIPGVNLSEAFFYARLSQIGVVFIPTLFFHFVYEFCQLKSLFDKYLISFGYIFSTIILISIPTPFFISGIIPKFNGLINFVTPGPLDYLFVVYFVFVSVYGIIHLAFQHLTSSGVHSQLARLFFWGALFAYLGAGPNFFLTFGINIYPWTPFGTYGPVINFVIVAYALFYYRFINIESVAQVFQREKLATIGLIASSINHEIRNPLYAAKGLLDNYLELKKEGLASKNPDEVTERARIQIQRALDVITKLNRFARPAQDSQAQIASIQEALTNVLDLISYEFELDKIHIRNEIPNDLPQIQADQRQVEEILFNLIVNACHAMKGKGEGTLEIRGMRNGKQVMIEIRDTGSGIPQEHLKHLFEPFHTTKGEKGTGLGLYITKQLVERNGGQINVTSSAGNGTTVTIRFPVVSVVSGSNTVSEAPVNP